MKDTCELNKRRLERFRTFLKIHLGRLTAFSLKVTTYMYIQHTYIQLHIVAGIGLISLKTSLELPVYMFLLTGTSLFR